MRGAAAALFALALGPGCSRAERPGPPGPPGLPATVAPGAAAPGLPSLELTPPSVPPERRLLGDEIKLRDYTLTAFEVAPCPESTAFPAAAGTRRLGVRVRFTGRSEQEVPIGPLYATVDAGPHGPVRAELGGCRPALVATHITRGQTAEGWLSFDLPVDGSGMTLLYAPAVVGSAAQVAAVALP